MDAKRSDPIPIIDPRVSTLNSVMSHLDLDSLIALSTSDDGTTTHISPNDVRRELIRRYNLPHDTSYEDAVRHSALTHPSKKSLDYYSPDIVFGECIKRRTNKHLMIHILNTRTLERKTIYSCILEAPARIVLMIAEKYPEVFEKVNQDMLTKCTNNVVRKVHKVRPFSVSDSSVHLMISENRYDLLMEIYPTFWENIHKSKYTYSDFYNMAVKSGNMKVLELFKTKFGKKRYISDDVILRSQSLEMYTYFYCGGDSFREGKGPDSEICDIFPLMSGDAGMELFNILISRSTTKFIESYGFRRSVIKADLLDAFIWLEENSESMRGSEVENVDMMVEFGSEKCFEYAWEKLSNDQKDELVESVNHCFGRGEDIAPNAYIFNKILEHSTMCRDCLMASCLDKKNLQVLKTLPPPNKGDTLEITYFYHVDLFPISFEDIETLRYMLSLRPPPENIMHDIISAYKDIPIAKELLSSYKL